jgi:hypothetical protein
MAIERFGFNGLSKRGRKQCNAKSKQTQVRCEYSACEDKDKCRFHGGKTGVVTGIYSKYLTGQLSDAIQAVEVERPQLDSELELLRALLAQTTQFLNLCQSIKVIEQLPLWATLLDMIKSLVGEIRSCEETINRMNDRQSITPEQVSIVISSLTKLLVKHVDKSKMKTLSSEFDKIPWPNKLQANGNGRAKLNGNGDGH